MQRLSRQVGDGFMWAVRTIGAAALTALLAVSMPARAADHAAETCSRTDFEVVVNTAADTLRTLTQKNSPAFQAKLRALKEKRGWTNEEFLAEGARFVQDEKIAEFEDRSGNLLARINGASSDTGSNTKIDCAQLPQLQAHLAALVEIQTAKWTYMFSTIDAELSK